MSNLYYTPQHFALTTVGEIEWGDGCYSFDLTVVWRRNIDGKLVYADDSGCSCPSPFEDHGVEDLKLCTADELLAHLNKRGEDAGAPYGRGMSDEHRMAIAELMARMVA